MITGCYDMHLYCRHENLPLSYVMDYEDCPLGHHRYGEFPHQFTGRTEGDCKAQARKRGWKFSKGDATCPRCARASA